MGQQDRGAAENVDVSNDVAVLELFGQGGECSTRLGGVEQRVRGDSVVGEVKAIEVDAAASEGRWCPQKRAGSG